MKKILILLISFFIVFLGCQQNTVSTNNNHSNSHNPAEEGGEEDIPSVPHLIGDIAYSDGTVSSSYDSNKNPVGIVIEVKNDIATKIMSLSEGTNLEYSTDTSATIGASSETDGKINHAVVEEITDWKDLYPAFAWCDNYTDAANNSNWYLPALNELLVIFNNKTAINNGIEKITIEDGEAISIGGSTDKYWSSTEGEWPTTAWYKRLDNGEQKEQLKTVKSKVRAVREF